jgi:hypothetical protein
MAASKGVAIEPRSPEQRREGLTQVLQGKDAMALQHSRLQEIQDQLLQQSLEVVQDAVKFSEIDEDAQAPPDAWVEELGMDRAMARLRMARAAWRNARDAPVGIKVAASVAVGIMKARATEKTAPKVLNVALVNWANPLPQFVEQDFERD